MNSPVPFNACSQAARSVGGGTANVPPGDDGTEEDDARGKPRRPEHEARLKAASEAATPPADNKNRRRSIPAFAAAESISSRTSRSVSQSSRHAPAGTN